MTEFEDNFTTSIEVVMLDLNFGAEINGIGLAKSLKSRGFDGEIYILSAENAQDIIQQSSEYVTEYIVKPATVDELERFTFNWS